LDRKKSFLSFFLIKKVFEALTKLKFCKKPLKNAILQAVGQEIARASAEPTVFCNSSVGLILSEGGRR
jgi:hypothetical protein